MLQRIKHAVGEEGAPGVPWTDSESSGPLLSGAVTPRAATTALPAGDAPLEARIRLLEAELNELRNRRDQAQVRALGMPPLSPIVAMHHYPPVRGHCPLSSYGTAASDPRHLHSQSRAGHRPTKHGSEAATAGGSSPLVGEDAPAQRASARVPSDGGDAPESSGRVPPRVASAALETTGAPRGAEGASSRHPARAAPAARARPSALGAGQKREGDAGGAAPSRQSARERVGDGRSSTEALAARAKPAKTVQEPHAPGTNGRVAIRNAFSVSEVPPGALRPSVEAARVAGSEEVASLFQSFGHLNGPAGSEAAPRSPVAAKRSIAAAVSSGAGGGASVGLGVTEGDGATRGASERKREEDEKKAKRDAKAAEIQAKLVAGIDYSMGLTTGHRLDKGPSMKGQQ